MKQNSNKLKVAISCGDVNGVGLEVIIKTFLDNKQDDLDKEYNTSNKFQTNVRGIKVRGVYSTQEEAEMRCKLLRNEDPNHDVYVGPVGVWLPFHPEAYKTGNVQYLEKELNNVQKI